MTSSEYDNLIQQLATNTDKLTRYDELQNDIDRMEAARGTITQVNFIAAYGTIAVSDTDMLGKAEAALVKLITARKDEQTTI